jgi:hypothetical protein
MTGLKIELTVITRYNQAPQGALNTALTALGITDITAVWSQPGPLGWTPSMPPQQAPLVDLTGPTAHLAQLLAKLWEPTFAVVRLSGEPMPYFNGTTRDGYTAAAGTNITATRNYTLGGVLGTLFTPNGPTSPAAQLPPNFATLLSRCDT